MTWVKKVDSQDRLKGHRCAPPGAPYDTSGTVYAPPHGIGLTSLWRCDECHLLWRVGHRCSTCEGYSKKKYRPSHNGHHVIGLRWYPATWWQRIRHKHEGFEGDFIV